MARKNARRALAKKTGWEKEKTGKDGIAVVASHPTGKNVNVRGASLAVLTQTNAVKQANNKREGLEDLARDLPCVETRSKYYVIGPNAGLFIPLDEASGHHHQALVEPRKQEIFMLTLPGTVMNTRCDARQNAPTSRPTSRHGDAVERCCLPQEERPFPEGQPHVLPVFPLI